MFEVSRDQEEVANYPHSIERTGFQRGEKTEIRAKKTIYGYLVVDDRILPNLPGKTGRRISEDPCSSFEDFTLNLMKSLDKEASTDNQ
jgi:hypothetical protein